MEDPPPYCTGPTDSAELPPTTDDLVAQAHAHRQGIPYPTGKQLLQNLPVLLRALCDYALSNTASPGELAYGLASMIDAIESATVDTRSVH
ncbi:MAG: hypothetical protein IPL99_25350 [Candidatus Competibacteraceae bacterium]|nr:hypothetical protein [Candidatus Competibacteraceae bacterium]